MERGMIPPEEVRFFGQDDALHVEVNGTWHGTTVDGVEAYIEPAEANPVLRRVGSVAEAWKPFDLIWSLAILHCCRPLWTHVGSGASPILSRPLCVATVVFPARPPP